MDIYEDIESIVDFILGGGNISAYGAFQAAKKVETWLATAAPKPREL